MKKEIFNVVLVILMAGMAACTGNSKKAAQNKQDSQREQSADHWFTSGEWLNGWQVTPDSTINQQALQAAYTKHPERWKKAIAFMRDSDLVNMEAKRYDLIGDTLFASVSDYMTKNPDSAHYEAHRKYIDIQYVAAGKELIGVSPLADTTQTFQPYNPVKDIGFYAVSPVVNHEATPGKLFIFFPTDAHRPGLRDGESAPVRKVVIKVAVD
ncbi:MAG TPA: YhcH/YjgK/YiaL family protein [Bacteroidales bacterium]|nr:YhcH/YjgK/YiaL family protein [Bacteroidales bacterium]